MNINIKDRDQMFSKLIDSIELKKEESEWSKNWKKACDELFATMTQEHIEHVIKGLKAISEERKTGLKKEPDNLTDVAALMLFFHAFDKIHNPDRKHPLFLPPHVAKVYLENPGAHPIAICNKCGYQYSGPHFKGCPYCESRL
jgi:rubrerythrin